MGGTWRRWLDAALVVPDAQVRWLDAGYQLYTYELFHKHPANRWVHALGIPLAATATCAWLVHGPWALPVGLAIGLLHGALALRVGSPALLAALAPLHLGIWLFGEHVMRPALAQVGLHPLVVVLACAAAQYLAHLFERDVPPPVSGGRWVTRNAFLRTTTLRAVARVMLLLPFHVAVELVSTPRNLFLLVLAATRGMGLLASTSVDRAFERAGRAIQRESPTLGADEFEKDA